MVIVEAIRLLVVLVVFHAGFVVVMIVLVDIGGDDGCVAMILVFPWSLLRVRCFLLC